MRNDHEIILQVQEAGPHHSQGVVTGENNKKEEEVVLWPDLEASANQESFAVDTATDLPLFYEETSNEEAAKNEEDVYAHPSETRESKHLQRIEQDLYGVMEVDDRENREPAQEVELDFSSPAEVARTFLHRSIDAVA